MADLDVRSVGGLCATTALIRTCREDAASSQAAESPASSVAALQRKLAVALEAQGRTSEAQAVLQALEDAGD